MIERIHIESFKSLTDVDVELGRLNVFIGANGSGKSNFLEAIGVLSAAASGQVNDGTLLCRGVRPGVPQLYKSSFKNEKIKSHIRLEGSNKIASYSVSLNNPTNSPLPNWQFKHEEWKENETLLASRYPGTKAQKEHGLAALKAVETVDASEGYKFLRLLQNYRIFTPTTGVLRGIVSETQPAAPLGLSGGKLPEAVREFLRSRSKDEFVKKVAADFFSFIDWANQYSFRSSMELPLSPSAAASQFVVSFRDKFMSEKRNILSGYDASEGALYILFLSVLVALPNSPRFCAVDNADHGLNPRLITAFFSKLSEWIIESPQQQQLLLTTHNPSVLDGLRLQDDRIRLFTVDRTNKGKTVIDRVIVSEKMLEKAKLGWPLSRLWLEGYFGGIPNV